jgi:hypothetical protein
VPRNYSRSARHCQVADGSVDVLGGHLPRRSLQRSIASAPHDVLHFLRRCVSERCYHREASGVSRRFVNELHARGQAEFGVDVGEVGLYGAR